MDDRNHTGHAYPADTASQLSLAHSATWHCLMVCGLGEVVGMIIGTALGFSNVNTAWHGVGPRGWIHCGFSRQLCIGWKRHTAGPLLGATHEH